MPGVGGVLFFLVAGEEGDQGRVRGGRGRGGSAGRREEGLRAGLLRKRNKKRREGAEK